MAGNLGEAVLTLSTDSLGMKRGLDSAKDLIETFVTLAAVKKLIALGTEMLNSFAEAQRGFITLTLATGKNADALHRWAGEMQKVTEFSDNQIEHNMALLGTMNLSETKMKDVMTSAMNLSSTLNIGLDQAVLGLAKSIETGSLGMLGRYIPALSSMSKEALLAGAAVQYGLAGKFKDAAVSIGDSVDGIQKRMKHVLDEQKEKIGGEIAATYVAIWKFTDLIDQVGSVAAKVIGFLVKVLVANQMIVVDFWRFIVDGFKTLGGLLQNLWKDILHPDKWLKDAEDAFIKMANHVKDYALEFKDLFAAQPPAINRVVVAQDGLGDAIVDNTEKMVVFFYRADSGWRQMVNSMVGESDKLTRGWNKTVNTMVQDSSIGWNRIANDMTGAIVHALKKIEDNFKDTFRNIQQTVSTVMSLLSAISAQYFKNLMNALDAAHQKEIEGYDSAYQAELDKLALMGLSEEDYAKAKLKLDLKYKLLKEAADKAYALKMKEIKKQEWESNKAIAIANVVVSTAEAVVKTLAAYPWPWDLIPAAIVAGLGAWQLSLITSEPEPAFAGGADFTVPPGYPNDSFPMRVESGEHVSVTPAGGGGGDMIHNTLILDGSVLADWVTKASRNKRILTTARSVVP